MGRVRGTRCKDAMIWGFARSRRYERSLGCWSETPRSWLCAASSGNPVPRFGTSTRSRHRYRVNRGEGPSEPPYDMALVAREHSAAIRGSAAERLHVLGENRRVSRTEANVIEACAVLTIGMRNTPERLEATDGSGPSPNRRRRMRKCCEASIRLAARARRAECVSRPRFCSEFTNLGVYSRAAQQSPVTEFMHEQVHQVGP